MSKKYYVFAARYNESLSAKTKMQREYEQAQAKKKQTNAADSRKPLTAEQQRPRHQDSSATGARKGGTTPAFSGDFVTLTKEQLKILLDAAESARGVSGSYIY